MPEESTLLVRIQFGVHHGPQVIPAKLLPNSQPAVMCGATLPQTPNFALLVEHDEVSVVPILSLSRSF